MIDFPETTNRILAVSPVTRGFGFAIIEDEPFVQLIDWGVTSCRKNKGKDCLQKIEMMIEAYEPNIVVVEDCAQVKSRRCHAVEPFLRKVIGLTVKKNISVKRFSEDEVQETFLGEDTTTNQEIAEAIASRFPELIPKLPKPRQIWNSEDYRMSIFDAVGLGLTALRLRQ